jgi:hypothetical protein
VAPSFSHGREFFLETNFKKRKKMKKTNFEANNKEILTPEEIAQAKQQYGRVFKVVVKDDDGTISAQAFLHSPTRQVLDAAMASSKKKDSMFNETIIKNCWLAGDKSIVENDEHFLSASAQINELIKFKESDLEEL